MSEFNIDYERLNAEISQEANAFAKTSGQASSIQNAAQLMQDMTTTYNQDYYIEKINHFVDKSFKALKQPKNEGQYMMFFAVYHILLTGYYEIQWDEDKSDDIKGFEWEGEFKQQADRKTFIYASRFIFKDVDKEMKGFLEGFDSPEVLSRRNVIEHIVLNRVKLVATTWKDEGLVHKSIQGFNHIGIG